MGQQSRALTPEQSPLHGFGADLRARRVRRGLSQAKLGERVLASAETVAKVEKAERWPTADLARRCDAALNADGELVRLWSGVDDYRRRLVTAGESLRLPRWRASLPRGADQSADDGS